MKISKTRYLGLMFSLLVLTVLLLGVLLVTAPWQHLGEYIEEDTAAPTSSDATQTTPYLSAHEIVIVKEETEEGDTQVTLPIEKVLFEYIEIIDGCGVHFQGTCLNVRSGPGTEFPSVTKLRNGMVLKVGGKVERASSTWYKIIFDEFIRYPERMTGDWYVNAEFVQVLYDEGDKTIWTSEYATPSAKRILVDRSEQKLYAYDGDVLFIEASISTGLELTPTPRGTFTIFKKTPSRYMQGPLPNLADTQVYDLPGVPWNMYFTHEGAVIHGAYWHDSFGSRYSHGCVNLPPATARELYGWADLGTTVVVQD